MTDLNELDERVEQELGAPFSILRGKLKWEIERTRASEANVAALRRAMERIVAVEPDEKGNHVEVIRSIAADALEYTADY